MQAIKQSAFLRPISRSSSPAPSNGTANPITDPGLPMESPAIHQMSRTGSRGPLNRLSLSSLRGRSPAVNGTPAAPMQPTTTLVQDGSYLEALGLKVSEAIAKALAPVNCTTHGAIPDDAYNGRKALPVGRGKALGGCISAELLAAKENPQLYKAIIRLLQRPMTVLLTNLSAQLLTVVSSAKFQIAETNGSLNAPQQHALAIATFASELLVTFNELKLGVGGLTEARGDGLQNAREGLESVITRVVTPLIMQIKQDLLPIITELEKAPADSWVPNTKSTAVGVFKSMTPSQGYHPAVNALQARVLIHHKSLERYQAIGGKLCDAQFASLIISLIWRALVSLAHRKAKESKASPPPTPNPTATIRKRLTPPNTPRMAISFKTVNPSRPTSPTIIPPTRGSDAKAILDLIELLPRPPKANVDANEAIDEAFDDLRALSVLIETLETFSGKLEEKDLEVLTEELPTLIALPVLLNFPSVVGPCELEKDVPALLGLEEKEYRQTCLLSFGREEECADAVVRKLLEVLASRGAGDSMVARWLRDELE